MMWQIQVGQLFYKLSFFLLSFALSAGKQKLNQGEKQGIVCFMKNYGSMWNFSGDILEGCPHKFDSSKKCINGKSTHIFKTKKEKCLQRDQIYLVERITRDIQCSMGDYYNHSVNIWFEYQNGWNHIKRNKTTNCVYPHPVPCED